MNLSEVEDALQLGKKHLLGSPNRADRSEFDSLTGYKRAFDDQWDRNSNLQLALS